MQFQQQNQDKHRSISDLYYSFVKIADEQMELESKVAIKVQAKFRMFVLRRKFIVIRNSTIYIQKVVRGFLARVLMKRNNDQRFNERNSKYYSNLAVVIQRHYRGYYYRKYYINFAVRKQFLQFLKNKNETFRGQLLEVEQMEIEDLKVREEQLARTEFEGLARNLHHLSSTQSQPGIYNKPYGGKDVVFDMEVESHLKQLPMVQESIEVTVYVIRQNELFDQIKTFIMIILLLIPLVFAKPLTKYNVLLAIDCGSEQSHLAEEGFQYSEDKEFFGKSRVADYTYNDAVDHDIKYTLNPKVYFTERHGESFGYRLAIPNGQYTIVLQFVELYFDDENSRQFDIFIGNRRILQNFSILDGNKKAGAKDLYLKVEVKDKQIYYKNQVCEDGYDKNHVFVRLEKGASDLPKLDGIIVIKGHDTDEEEKQLLIANWENIAKEPEEDIQPSDDIIQTEQKKSEISNDIDQNEQTESLFAFFTTPIGLSILAAVFIFVIAVNVVDSGPKKPKKQKEQKRQ